MILLILLILRKLFQVYLGRFGHVNNHWGNNMDISPHFLFRRFFPVLEMANNLFSEDLIRWKNGIPRLSVRISCPLYLTMPASVVIIR